MLCERPLKAACGLHQHQRDIQALQSRQQCGHAGFVVAKLFGCPLVVKRHFQRRLGYVNADKQRHLLLRSLRHSPTL